MKALLVKRYSHGLAVKFNDSTLANPRGVIGLNILLVLSTLELGCSLAMGCVNVIRSCEDPGACLNQGLLLPWPQGGRWGLQQYFSPRCWSETFQQLLQLLFKLQAWSLAVKDGFPQLGLLPKGGLILHPTGAVELVRFVLGYVIALGRGDSAGHEMDGSSRLRHRGEGCQGCIAHWCTTPAGCWAASLSSPGKGV